MELDLLKFELIQITRFHYESRSVQFTTTLPSLNICATYAMYVDI